MTEPTPPEAEKPRLAAEPPSAAILRRAISALDEAKARHAAAAEKIAAARAEEDAAQRDHERAEALAAAGVEVDVDGAAQRAEAAAAEVKRAERAAAGLARMVEEKRAAVLAPLAEARGDLVRWVDAAMASLDAEFRTAAEAAGAVLARAVGVLDAAGDRDLVEPALRVRVPVSFLRTDAVSQVGHQPGKAPPKASPLSDTAGRLRGLIAAAERAATPSKPEREAA